MSEELGPGSDDYPGQLLHQAALYNNKELLLSLLEGDELQHINARDRCGRTPLYTAVTNLSMDCAKILLEKGGDPNMKTGVKHGGKTALHAAVEENQLIFVELLLKYKADLNVLSTLGDKPLDIARRSGFQTIVNTIDKEVEKRQQRRNKCVKGVYKALAEGDLAKAKKFCQELPEGIQGIVNYAPEGEESLLSRACEMGNAELVQFLLDNGANGQFVMETGLSPLHIACSSGKPEIVRLILQHFPELIRTPSSADGSLPIHFAAERGYTDIVKLLLDFPYPESLKQTYTDAEGKQSYKSGIYMNAREGHGRTPLHLACATNNPETVQVLLDHRVEPARQEAKASSGTNDSEETFSPMDVNAVDLDELTPLLVAIRGNNNGSFYNVAHLLIQNGASVNKRFIDLAAKRNSNPLYEACHKGDIQMVNLLMQSGAQDDQNTVLNKAVNSKNDAVASVMLKYKSHVDMEYKISKLLMYEAFERQQGKIAEEDKYKTFSTLYRKKFPTNPVVVNWHNLGLDKIEEPWLFQAVLIHNSFLGKAAKQTISLAMFAITRLVLSQNNLETLPVLVFQLGSLRTLNASQNRIYKLPSSEVQPEETGTLSMHTPNVSTWNCPCLEDINLSDNLLTSLPPELFQLPALHKLTAARNSIQSVAYDMWFAPNLTSIDLSHNKLSSLPVVPPGDIVTSEIKLKNPSQLNVSAAVTGVSQNGIDPVGGNIVKSQITHLNRWVGKVRVKRSVSVDSHDGEFKDVWLKDLDLSHNQFVEVPVGLSCLASHLERLNLSYNRLDQVGPLDQYPAMLQKLDLSHNRILSGAILFDTKFDEERNLPCFKSFSGNKKSKRESATEPGRVRSDTGILHVSVMGDGQLCPHRSHRRLEALKHLLLHHNKLQALTLLTKEDPVLTLGGEENGDQVSSTQTSQSSSGTTSDHGTNSENMKARLLFPNLSLLDVSDNLITAIPPEISEMGSLSEFKVVRNKVKELPPELGLLAKKLWNFDFTDCPVERELRAILGDKIKKTSTVLGYLKSLKEEATSYNRMKLMFVGVQGIGKTSLLQLLRKEGRAQPSRYKTWAERMGIQATDQSGRNMSTVGVDIGDLVLSRGGKEVVFKTWDFGGQKEYYATHQYFLSKRSLYLVMWKVTGGERAVEGIQQWLVNIQARAPNSPVIIVGTHIDAIDRTYPENFLRDLHELVEQKYVRVSEPEKSGIPRVMSAIEVSCKTKRSFFSSNNIPALVDLIWRVVSEERVPGNQHVKLLEQKIPGSYKILEDVVTQLARERPEPVLTDSEYKYYVTDRMNKLYETSFKDSAELNQATQFLHDNGVLLHYDDVNLQNVYFLDPQWLCDMLAKVVTIKEINSFATSGNMKISDLKFLFRNSPRADPSKVSRVKDYIIDLLNKFEVALQYDEEYLLIPSLLPSEQQVKKRCCQIRILAGGFQKMELPPYHAELASVLGQDYEPNQPNSRFYIETDLPVPSPASPFSLMNSMHISTSVSSVQEPIIEETSASEAPSSEHEDPQPVPDIVHSSDPSVSLCRLYLMSYFPSGFWPRLITRLLADKTFSSLTRDLYPIPEDVLALYAHEKKVAFEPEWNCWQTGLELYYLRTKICSIKEIPKDPHDTMCNYRWCQMLIQDTDTSWSKVDVETTAILEILIPNNTVRFEWEHELSNSSNADSQSTKEENDGTVSLSSADKEECEKGNLQMVEPALTEAEVEVILKGTGADSDGILSDFDVVDFSGSLKSYDTKSKSDTCLSESRVEIVYPSIEASAALLACIVEHIDNLLEDWYPDLGLRFVQNSTGMYLITRIVPCMHCLSNQVMLQREGDVRNVWMLVGDSGQSSGTVMVRPGGHGAEQTYGKDDDDHIKVPSRSGSLPAVSNYLPYVAPVARTVGNVVSYAVDMLPSLPPWTVYCRTVEECIYSAHQHGELLCILHGPISLVPSAESEDPHMQHAPDVVFLDIGDKYLYDHDKVNRGRFLGKGSFGAVFAGTVTEKTHGKDIDVAIKMLQPVNPGEGASSTDLAQYQIDQKKWNRDPMKSTCEAYLNARKELSILLNLKHPCIVPLVGVSLKPLCLLLQLAPEGALNEVLKNYRRAGARLPFAALQKIIVQVASALEYLHNQQIIYRDLKSENVLVWSLPRPHDLDLSRPVDVKLADYGVSRTVLPSGTKGFAGTPPFIAPEIIQHSGEESYTEKVDCFSFGMFMYELLMLKLPFEGQDSAVLGNIKGYVLAGGRPAMSDNDLIYPTHMLDLMTQCWSHDPHDRPSTTEILTIANSAEFCHLRDVVPLETQVEVSCAASFPVQTDDKDFDPETEEENVGKSEIWIASKLEGQKDRVIQILSVQHEVCYQSRTVPVGDENITCMCAVEQNIWCCTQKFVNVFRAKDCTKILKFEAKPGHNIRTVVYDQMDRQVYVVLESGRFVVCKADIPHSKGALFHPVIQECPNNNKPIHSVAVFPRSPNCSELWCGQDQGVISIWSFHANPGYWRVAHSRRELAAGGVASLITGPPGCQAVWSYIYPDSIVYRWDSETRKITGSLDCSVVIPVADKHHNDARKLLQDGQRLLSGKCQVTSMKVMHTELFLATSWGCVAVVDAHKMVPLSVFRCHYDATQNIKVTLLPLTFTSADLALQGETASVPQPAIATLGRGYRDLMDCYKQQEALTIHGPMVRLPNHILTWSSVGWQYSGKASLSMLSDA